MDKYKYAFFAQSAAHFVTWAASTYTIKKQAEDYKKAYGRCKQLIEIIQVEEVAEAIERSPEAMEKLKFFNSMNAAGLS